MEADGGERHRRKLTISGWRTAITIVVVVIAATGLGVGIAWTEHWIGPKLNPVGPALSVVAQGISSSAAVNLSGALVAVSSIVPSTIGDNPTSSNTTEEVLLFQGTTNGEGVVAGNLGTEFTAVDQQWQNIISPITNTVSLNVVGTYFAPASNGSELMYSAYNAVAYNPRAPPAEFSFGLYFNLAKPAAVIPASGSVSAAGLTPATSCPPEEETITTNYDTTITGPFPILMVNNTERSSTGLPFVTFGDSIANGTFQFEFTEAEASSASSSVSMSSGSTWGGKAPTNFNGATSGAEPLSTASIGMISLENVSINILRQTYTYTIFTGPNCLPHSYSTQYAWARIVDVKSNSFDFVGIAVNSAYGQLVAELDAESGIETVANRTTTAGHSQYWVNMEEQATGYSNVQSLLSGVVNAESYFMTALDLGFSLADMFEACGIFCEPGSIADTVAVLSDALGFATYINTAMSSISYEVNLNTTVDETIVTAIDGNFNFQVLGSSYQTTLTTSSGSANANMPQGIIAWPE